MPQAEEEQRSLQEILTTIDALQLVLHAEYIDPLGLSFYTERQVT
jgi:hypothetical protein